MPKASLCFLSYERPNFLHKAVETAITNAGTDDFEVIIHDDGSTDPSVENKITYLRHGFDIEKIILKQPGTNEGVGKAINNSFKLAEGKYLFKLDQDLIFKPGWLAEATRLLEWHPSIALLGLFKYHHDPVDHKKTLIDKDDFYEKHTHICGSGFGISREQFDYFGIENHSEAYAEDWDLMKRIDSSPYVFNALPLEDLAENQGFGIGPSTVVMKDGSVRPICKGLKQRG